MFDRLAWRLFPRRTQRKYLLDLILEVAADSALAAAMRADEEAAEDRAWREYLDNLADEYEWPQVEIGEYVPTSDEEAAVQKSLAAMEERDREYAIWE
jgi:hypothetical protein